MQQQKEMIYLFSSTSRDQYIQDTLNILALPPHAIFHFRYNLKYVSPELSQKQDQSDDHYKQTLQKYRDHEALIVLVDQPLQTASTTLDEDIHFYPLRQAKIKEFKLDGIVLHIYFELVDYIYLDQQRAIAFEQAIKAQSGQTYERPPRKYISTGLSVLDDDALASSNFSAQAWMSTIDTISTMLSVFENTVFYRCLGMRKIKAHHVALRAFGRLWSTDMLSDKREEVIIGEPLPYESGYILKRGELYSLDLSFYHSEEVKEPVKGCSILAQVDKERFAFVPNEIEVTFRYDIQSVELVTIPANQDAFTKIRLYAKPKEQDKNKTYNPPLRAPVTDFIIKLTYPRFRYVGAFVLLLIAQIIVAIPDVINALPVFHSVPQAIIKVLGSAITAVVLFSLLNKLPGS